MEEMRDCQWTADLLDYGLLGQDWWLVMPLYTASLKQWRSKQPPGIGDRLPLYSALFMQLVQAVMVSYSKLLALPSQYRDFDYSFDCPLEWVWQAEVLKMYKS